MVGDSEVRSVSLRESAGHHRCRTTDESKHHGDKKRDRQRLGCDSTIGEDRGRRRSGQHDGGNKEASDLRGVEPAGESPREEGRGSRSKLKRNDDQRSREEIRDDAVQNRRESPSERSLSGASNAERSESHRHRHNDSGNIRHVNLSKSTHRRRSDHSSGPSAPGKSEIGAPNSTRTRRESDVNDYSRKRGVDAGPSSTGVDNYESSPGVAKVSVQKNDPAGATSREAGSALELTLVESGERRSEPAESPEPHRVSGTSSSCVRVSEAPGGEDGINADAVPETRIHRNDSGGAGKASEWDGELQVEFGTRREPMRSSISYIGIVAARLTTGKDNLPGTALP